MRLMCDEEMLKWRWIKEGTSSWSLCTIRYCSKTAYIKLWLPDTRKKIIFGESDPNKVLLLSSIL